MKKYTDENYVDSIFQKVYPVGSIYLSTNSINPSILFEFGEWEQIQDVFLLAAGSSYAVGSTGGEAAHTLSVNEMPKHWHQVVNETGENGLEGLSAATTGGIDSTNWSFIDDPYDENNLGSGPFRTTEVGGNAAHNNMPPYLTVYMWKRTG